MQHVSANGGVVRGLDVSHHSGNIDFAKVKANGYDFCWAKCTEGVSNLDPRYAGNAIKARAAGLFFGAYHFFRPGQDAAKQAEWFLKHANLQAGDLRPMFDWEVVQSRDSDPLRAKTWLSIVDKQIGHPSIIYGPPYMLNDFGLPIDFADHPLCVAHYGTNSPLVPAPWKVWSFHQFTDKGAVPGVPVNEDLDRFNGSMANLLKLSI